jgi:MFS family permease
MSRRNKGGKPGLWILASLCVAGAAAVYLSVLIAGNGDWPGSAAFPENWPGSVWVWPYVDRYAPILGGLVIGLRMDQYGRVSTLVAAVLIMGIAALVIGTFPKEVPYVPRAISDVLPWTAIRAELFLGVAVAAGAVVYLAEVAPVTRKGLYVSFQTLGWLLAGAIASIVLDRELTFGPYARIVVLSGCIVLPLLPVLWRQMPETLALLPRPYRPGTRVALSAIAADWRSLVMGIMLALPFPWVIQTMTREIRDTIDFGAGWGWSAGEGATMLLAVASAAWVSDKIGRRKILITLIALLITVGMIFVLFPYWSPAVPWSVFPTVSIMLSYIAALLCGAYCGLLLVCLAEMMVVELRATCVALVLSATVLLEPVLFDWIFVPLVRFPSYWAPDFLLPLFSEPTSADLWILAALAAVSLVPAAKIHDWRDVRPIVTAEHFGAYPQLESSAGDARPPLRDSAGDPDWREKLLASLNDEHVIHARRGDPLLIQAGAIFGIIGIIAVALAIEFLLYVYLKERNVEAEAIQSSRVFYSVTLGPMAAYLVILFRRAGARLAGDELLVSGSRRPIFYLRSFDLDKLIARASFFDLLAGPWLPNPEQMMARRLRRYGPVIAIGRPGELLPPIGAGRFYVDDNHWKEKVTDVVKAAQLVIWTTGTTGGLRWEVSHLLETTPKEKLVIMAHPHLMRILPPDREIEWRAFLDTLGNAFPKPFPDYLGIIRFFHFDREQKPRGEVTLKALLRVKGFIEPPLFGLPGFRRITRGLARRFGATLRGAAAWLSLALMAGTVALFFATGLLVESFNYSDHEFMVDYVLPAPFLICALLFVLSLLNLVIVAVKTWRQN